jgi:hypothetical protein
LLQLSDAYHDFAKSFVLVEIVQLALVLSAGFPILAAPFARAAYYRRVTRFMSFCQVRFPPAAWWARRERHGARSVLAANVTEAATSPDAFADTMRDRLQRIRRATLAAYVVFVFGTGLSVPLHRGDAPEFALAAAALAIGPALVNATYRTIPRWAPLLVATLLTISMTFDRFEDWRGVAFGFGLVFAFYLVGTNRTLRELYVPLFFVAFIALGVVGVVAAVDLALRRFAAVSHTVQSSKANRVCE